MINTIKYSDILDKVASATSGLLTPTATSELNEDKAKFKELVEKSKYIKVPLVGVFSAGKSSLLNVFTGRPDVLPVDIMPETAVAYEIHYSTDEKVELFRNGKKIEEKSLPDIKSLSTTPGDIAIVHLNSEPIKQLQDKGIILVDMPGIGSGIDRHDAAIMNYINEGISFILLVDAEQGSLRGSTLVFLEELKKYNLRPAVLVSKIDKKPEKDVQDIIDYIAYQMSKLTEGIPYVSKVCAVDKNLQGLTTYLNGLDANAILRDRVSKNLKNIIDMAVADMQMQIDLKGKNIADIEKTMTIIENEINNLKPESPAISSQADTPEKSCQDILDNVNLALRQKGEEIAKMILNGTELEVIKSFITSVIRAELISSFKEEAEQYSDAIGTSIDKALSNLDGIKISDTDFNDIFGDLSTLAAEIARILGGQWGKIFALIQPFLKPILAFLSNIFGKNESEKLAEIKEKLQDACFSKIVENLRPGVYKLVKDNQKKIKDQYRQEVEAAFNRMKDGLQSKIAEANQSKEATIAEINRLNDAISTLKGIENSI